MRGSSTLADQFPKNGIGCYIIRSRQHVIYIGQSKRLRSRWIEHHWRGFVEENFPDAVVEIIPCELYELTGLEKELIEDYKPIINGGIPRNYEKYMSPDVLELQRKQQENEFKWTVRTLGVYGYIAKNFRVSK